VKFGAIPLDDAEGAILAHSIRLTGRALKKGRVLDRADVAALRAAGHGTVVAVRLEPNDLDENAAALRIAEACAGAHTGVDMPFTGRCNIRATGAGLFVVDPGRVNALNSVHESVTLSTISPYAAVSPGQLVATVKIITFGVASETVERAIGAGGSGLIQLAPFQTLKTGLIQTRLPGTKESVLDKTVETTRARLGALGLALDHETRCPHDVADVSAALGRLEEAACDIALVLGASAIVDRRDVVPAAVEHAGGTVEHLGMPVDPGNLMLLARCGGMRVLGLPGSARSPRLHGFDWVLQRLAAGIPVSGQDIMAMGVGGLLKEIPSRPMPRGDSTVRSTPRLRIAAIVLAAGQSRRAGKINKLLVEIDGKPMVARVLDAVRGAEVDPVIVVLGHQPDQVRAALADHDVTLVENPDYAMGLSTSLARGLAVLPLKIDGVIVCLGDMPDVTTAHIERLIEAFAPDEGRDICVPTFNGKRGNPVLWARHYIDEIANVSGDVGARHLIGEHADAVVEVAMSDGGVLLDLDTPEALAARASGGEA
jgi:molybdenum cofactor cytidylyltransferase